MSCPLVLSFLPPGLLSICPSICPSIHHPSIHLSIHKIYLYAYAAYLSSYLPVYQFCLLYIPSYLSTNLLPYLPVYQPIALSTCMFDHYCCLLIVHHCALQNIMHSWTHGGDPVDLLLINQHVEKFKVVDSAVQFPSIGTSIHSSTHSSIYPSTNPLTLICFLSIHALS